MNDHRVFVVGLDGIPQSLLKEYMDKGLLPEFSRIMGSGYALNQMDASIPDVSSTSWTSFMTGVNPAEHGIYGFIELQPGTYDLYFPNFRNVTAPTIWEIADAAPDGKTSTLYQRYRDIFSRPTRSVVLNIPQTYPATSLNGVITAGFVCPDLSRGTYPDTAYEYLRSIGYMSDVDSTIAATDQAAFLDEVKTSLERRLQAYEHFVRNEDWDVFIGVVTETDRMHHFYFEAAYDQGHPMHDVFIEFYGRIDRMVGRLYDLFMEKTGGEGLFMTMSDHGFTRLDREFYLNGWLKREGFLKLDTSREYFDQIDNGSRAFALDPGRIYLNIEGKYPRGAVSESEKSGLAAELKAGLESLTDGNGNHVIREVHANPDIYNGPLATRGPDLVCLANDGFDIKGNISKDEVFGKGHFTGMHTSYDAHCILPEAAVPGDRLHIEHLGGIILEHLSNAGRK